MRPKDFVIDDVPCIRFRGDTVEVPPDTALIKRQQQAAKELKCDHGTNPERWDNRMADNGDAWRVCTKCGRYEER